MSGVKGHGRDEEEGHLPSVLAATAAAFRTYFESWMSKREMPLSEDGADRQTEACHRRTSCD